MEHSKNFEKIKGYYGSELWTIGRVWMAVGKATGITETEYQEITGFVYPEKISVD